jgi:hypothetical protein
MGEACERLVIGACGRRLLRKWRRRVSASLLEVVRLRL